MSDNSSAVSQNRGTHDMDTFLSNFFKGAKRLFWIFLVFGAAAALIFCSISRKNYKPQYISSATFTVSISDSYGIEQSEYNSKVAQQMALTFPYILESGVLMDMIEAQLNNPGLEGALAASAPIEGYNFFTLSAVASDPITCEEILMAALENYPRISAYVVGDTRMGEPDITPAELANPFSYTRDIIAGFIAGFALFVLNCILYALSRSTVRKPEDIKKLLNTRCICSIPKISHKKRSSRKSDPVLLSHVGEEDYSFREAYRLLRTRIEREKDKKIILVTSALASEGKTTVSVNLASSLAMRGHKVLLIDCDIANPSVARTLGIKNDITTGILEYLKGDVPVDRIGMKIPSLGNLMVIPGKTRTSSSVEILANGRMKELIDQMKDYVDYIILDSSPAGLLTDCSVLAGLADCSIYVVRQDYSDRDSIIDGAENLAEHGLPMLGCVLNIVEKAFTSRYSYGYSYNYNRYSHYAKNYGKRD